MLLDRSGIRIFVHKEPIDMRAGFEKLHFYCVQHMEAKMNEGHAYLFFGRNRARMKILVYDGSGLVLIAKRIERNRFMSHADLLGRSEITLIELKQLFHGGVVRAPVFGKEADRLEKEAFEARFGAVGVEKMITTQRERLALPTGEMNELRT
jgi:transposase